jgi:hypothetical protein
MRSHYSIENEEALFNREKILCGFRGERRRETEFRNTLHEHERTYEGIHDPDDPGSMQIQQVLVRQIQEVESQDQVV